DQFAAHRAAFDLDRLGPGFLHKSNCVGNALGDAGVVGTEGHIRRDDSALDRPADGAGVMQHLVHRDGQSRLIAHHHHGQRVAYKDQVHAGLVHQPRRGIVVGRQRGDWLMRPFLLLQCLESNFGSSAGGGVAAEIRHAHDVSSAASSKEECRPILNSDDTLGENLSKAREIVHHCPGRSYSLCRASMRSAPDARLAGSADATSASSSMATAENASTPGSNGLTSNKNERSNCDAAAAPSSPMKQPTAASLTPETRTNMSTPNRWQPSAMRT